MPLLPSAVDPRSAAFARNADAMKRLVEDLRGKLAEATHGGTEEARARHVGRGKLLVRERR